MALALPADVRTADAMVPVPYRVVGRARETADTVTLSLEPVDQPITTPAPGQFNMLYAFGVGEVPISISGDPAAPGTIVHTTREVGTVTRAMRQLKRGDRLRKHDARASWFCSMAAPTMRVTPMP